MESLIAVVAFVIGLALFMWALGGPLKRSREQNDRLREFDPRAAAKRDSEGGYPGGF